MTAAPGGTGTAQPNGPATSTPGTPAPTPAPAATSTTTTVAATAASFRARFRFRQAWHRRFWPFWTAVALAVLSLQVPWVAEQSFGYMEYCTSSYQLGCGYGQYSHWKDSSWGGYGPGDVTWAVLALLVVAVLWAAARRDLRRPTWFDQVPRLLLAGWLLVFALNIAGAVPGTWFEVDQYGGVWGGDLGWGPVLFGFAALPLWRGLRRLRAALDTPSAAASPSSGEPASATPATATSPAPPDPA